MHKFSVGYTILFVVLLLGYSCKHRPRVENIQSMKDVTIIKIDKPPFYFKTIKFEEYFKSWRLISLETKKESLIGNINRIIYYHNRFFIGDRQTKSVFVFADNGKFIFKINRFGRGPGEFQGLADVTIDESSQQIVIHSDRPSKLLYFSLDGAFIRETEMNDYFPFMGYSEDHLLFVNFDPSLNYFFFSKSSNSNEYKPFVKITPTGELFRDSRTVYPYCLKSQSMNLFFGFSNIVYQFSGGVIKPKYGIDFGEANIPTNFFDNNQAPNQLFRTAFRNHYGFGLSNFRETKRYLIFSYAGNIMVIYDKTTKKAQAFHFVENTKGLINFENYFGHDGPDNGIMTIYASSVFTEQMRRYQKSPEDWSKLSDSVKTIARTINASSNPLIIYYTLKD